MNTSISSAAQGEIRRQRVPDLNTFLQYEVMSARWLRWFSRVSSPRTQAILARLFLRRTKRKYQEYTSSLRSATRFALQNSLTLANAHTEVILSNRHEADRFSLRVEIAECVLGWRRISVGDTIVKSILEPHSKEPGTVYWVDDAGHVRACSACDDLPEFDEDYNAVQEVEMRIQALGLQAQYAKALCSIVTGYGLLANVASYWGVINATPHQKCLAAWQVIKAKPEDV